MKYIVLVGILMVSSCASLNHEVFEKIHEGDPGTKVIELFGQPQQFGPSQRIEGAQAWYYTRRKEMCGFAIKDEKVAAMACTGTHQSAGTTTAKVIGAMFKGMGSGLQQSNQQSTHCMTTYGYGIANTNCD